jgi:hypothetical protein
MKGDSKKYSEPRAQRQNFRCPVKSKGTFERFVRWRERFPEEKKIYHGAEKKEKRVSE